MSEQLLTFDMTAHPYIYEFFKRFLSAIFHLMHSLL